MPPDAAPPCGCTEGQYCDPEGTCGANPAPTGAYCGPTADCSPDDVDYPDCMNSQCLSMHCGPLTGIALFRNVCTRGWAIQQNLEPPYGVEAPGFESDCQPPEIWDGPAGVEYHCVNHAEPGQSVNGYCLPGTDFHECGSDADCKGAGKDNAVGGALNRLDIVKYGPGQEPKFFKQELTGKQNVGDAGQNIGIDEMNPNAGARSVAMSRLDELLQSDVIAKTDFGTHTSSTLTRHAKMAQAKPKVGLMQAQAQGKSMQELIEGDQLAATDAEKSQPGKAGMVSVADPELQKKLSILQVIDVVAGQMDRHGGNFYIQFDPASGKVSEVTGIDLDMSFGKNHTDIEDKPSALHYKGMLALVDRKFAERILSITDDQLRAVLEPLLGPEELTAAMARWMQVQNPLKVKRATNQLVDEWNPSTARQQTDPDSSYLGQARAFLFLNAMDQALQIVQARRPQIFGYWNNILGPRCVKRAAPSPDLTPQHMITVVRTVMDDLDTMPEWQHWQQKMPLAMAARTEHLAALQTSHDLGAARDANRWQRFQPDEDLKAKLNEWHTDTAYGYIDFYKAQPDLAVPPPPAPPPGPAPAKWQQFIDEHQQKPVRSAHAPASGWRAKG